MVPKIYYNSNIHQEIIIACLSLAGYVPAFKQIWIIGDSFLKTTQSCLTALKTAYINDPTKPRLYIHDHYDVITLFEDEPGNENFVKQVRNNLAQLMKTHYKLPEKIIVMLNNTLLDDTAFAVTQLTELLKWLLSEIETAINYRRKYLPIRCLQPGEPAVYLLKMLPRGNKMVNTSTFKSVRRKINNQIPTITEKFEFGFINAYEINSSTSLFFDRHGKHLSPTGTMKFWESVSDTIKEMNEDKLQKAKIHDAPKERATERAEIDKKDSQKIRPELQQNPNFRRSQSSAFYHQRRRTYDYGTYDYNRYHFHAGRKY